VACNLRAEMRVGSIPTLDSVSKRYDALGFDTWSYDCDSERTLDTNSCHVGTSDGREGSKLGLAELTYPEVPASSKSSSYSSSSVAAMAESRKTVLPV